MKKTTLSAAAAVAALLAWATPARADDAPIVDCEHLTASQGALFEAWKNGSGVLPPELLPCVEEDNTNETASPPASPAPSPTTPAPTQTAPPEQPHNSVDEMIEDSARADQLAEQRYREEARRRSRDPGATRGPADLPERTSPSAPPSVPSEPATPTTSPTATPSSQPERTRRGEDVHAATRSTTRTQAGSGPLIPAAAGIAGALLAGAIGTLALARKSREAKESA